MNTHKILEKELYGNTFSFRDMTEFLGNDLPGNSFMFDGFIFQYCEKGSLRIRINYSEYSVSAGDMFVVLPKHIFTVLECTPDFKVKMLFSPLDCVHNLPVKPDMDLLRNINVCPCVELSEEKQKELENLYSIVRHYDNPDVQSQQIKNALMLSLVLIVISVFTKSVSQCEGLYSRAENLTRSFFTLLLQHFETERNVSFYANKLCITPKYLSTIIKSVTKFSVQNWINEVVLIEIKRYLRTTEQTVQQISERLHFSTPSSFVRFFRMHTGETPLAYRKKR